MKRLFAAILAPAFAIGASSAHAESPGLEAAALAGAPAHYAPANGLASFPVPAVVWRRAGLMHGDAEQEEIRQRVIYPLIRHALKPVSALVVEFQPMAESQLGIVVVWADGSYREGMIPRPVSGKYDPAAYELLLANPTP